MSTGRVAPPVYGLDRAHDTADFFLAYYVRRVLQVAAAASTTGSRAEGGSRGLCPKTGLLRSAVFLDFAVVAGCENPTAPGIEPEITNNADSFFYQVRDIRNFTGTREYTWQNGGTLATVSHSTNAGSTGTAILTLLDAAGTQVYSGPLLTGGEPTTSPAGVAGAWTVRIAYADNTNSGVNFELSRQLWTLRPSTGSRQRRRVGGPEAPPDLRKAPLSRKSVGHAHPTPARRGGRHRFPVCGRLSAAADGGHYRHRQHGLGHGPHPGP